MKLVTFEWAVGGQSQSQRAEMVGRRQHASPRTPSHSHQSSYTNTTASDMGEWNTGVGVVVKIIG